MTYDHINYFDYELPEQLIAQHPLDERAASRLLRVNVNNRSLEHSHFTNLVDFLRPKDLLVVNNTKVFPARLYGKKMTGGHVECLIERVLSNQRALVHLKASKSPKPGTKLQFKTLSATVIERLQNLFVVEFSCKDLLDRFEKLGHIPLPPYIKRYEMQNDKERYQTVYAKHRGSVAAPTAGLHFTDELMNFIKKKGISVAELTLHVGSGTFQPVYVNKLDEHIIHKEYVEVPKTVCASVEDCRQNSGRVIAVGTTTLRALESAARGGKLIPFQGETDLFIRPGYNFRCVDVLVTNFHLPKSTLLMLVTAFGGYELIMSSYREAIKKKYRFYSYGDAMLVER